MDEKYYYNARWASRQNLQNACIRLCVCSVRAYVYCLNAFAGSICVAVAVAVAAALRFSLVRLVSPVRPSFIIDFWPAKRILCLHCSPSIQKRLLCSALLYY
ncbi:hypothetical protein T08_16562 [Trichinella sp. T8]|nr:hypothetical protein T08_16562 [Trichinella sp. T8]